MMRFLIAGLFIFPFLITSCSKDDKDDPEIEYEYRDIHDYAREHFPEADSLDNGMYVIITHEGSGSKPVHNEELYVFYSGYLLTGQGFDTIRHRRKTDFQPPVMPTAPSEDATEEELEEYEELLEEYEEELEAYEKLIANIDGLYKFRFQTTNVIVGWHEGFAKLNKGSKAVFLIPAHLAYGGSSPGIIPPNSPLRFDVELVNPTPSTR